MFTPKNISFKSKLIKKKQEICAKIANFFIFKKTSAVLSALDTKLETIFKKAPLLFSFAVSLLTLCSFNDYKLNSLFIISILLYLRILFILFSERRTKKVFFSGLFYGMGIYFSAFRWLLALQEFGFKTPGIEDFLAVFGFVGASFYLSIYTGLSAYLSVKLAFNKISLFILFSSFITIFEIFSRNIVDLAPLVVLAYGICNFKYFIQIAAVVGTFGVTFLLFFILSLISVKGYRKYGIYIFIFCFFYGYYKLNLKNDYLIPKEKFDIAVVQANFDDDDRSYSCNACSDNFATLANIDNIRNQKRKLLVIAPETIIYDNHDEKEYFVKRGCGYFKNDGYLNKNRFTNINKKGLSNIIVCTGFIDRTNKEIHNTYQFFTYNYKKNGIKRLDFYNKVYLIPFGEIVPDWVYKIIAFIPKRFKYIHDMFAEFKAASYTRGKGSNTIKIDGISPFAMEICSDIISPGLSLQDTYEPTWMLSTMNFHTFNGKNKVTNLSHLGLLFGMFRAIEFSRPVVMCINFGYSCIIDCNGNVLKILKTKSPGTIHHEMPMKYDVSIFSIFKHKIILFIIFFILGFMFLSKGSKKTSFGRFKK